MTKTTYKDAKNKRKVRDFMIDHFIFNRVIGLAGPDINDYIDYFKGKELIIYENNLKVLGHQLTVIKKPVSMKFGNILDAYEEKQTFLDLDYCATVPTLKEHIQKFKDNFIMTFSLRGVKVEKSLALFFKYRKEEILKVVEEVTPIKHKLFITTGGKYITASYLDTSPMLSIAKIK